MARWYYNRPLEKVDPTELEVAQILSGLSDDWHIRWGYFYERSGKEALRDKEGDFIILGPSGHILVMEVKGGQNRQFVLTGKWEYQSDNPLSQLNDEWKGVLNDLAKRYHQRLPYVGKALCMPRVNLVSQERVARSFGEVSVVFGKDLEDFNGWWMKNVAVRKTSCPDPVKAFHAGLADELQPAAVQLFIKQTDRLLNQFKAAEFEVLTMLQNNRHLMVEGGAGTGKTFLALKQAEWLAEQGEGRRVLFLAYNLLLAERVRQMVDKLKLKCGAIEVLSWQDLVDRVISAEGLELQIPKEREAMAAYFKEELPGYVQMAFEGGKVEAGYDALIVDEAQDHDTRIEGVEGAGWWDWYLRLLKEGAEAPIALFYDCAQRPAFRKPDLFLPESLRAALGGAVHVRLKKALRYTRPIFDYLKTLNSEVTAPLIDAIEAHDALPTGPEVEHRSAAKEAILAEVEAMVADWKTSGLCRPEDVVLIGPNRELQDSPLGEGATVGGLTVVDYHEDSRGELGYLGAHRAKGMDFLAVILIGFQGFEALTQDNSNKGKDLQEAYFAGASRARQILGVVSDISS